MLHVYTGLSQSDLPPWRDYAINLKFRVVKLARFISYKLIERFTLLYAKFHPLFLVPRPRCSWSVYANVYVFISVTAPPDKTRPIQTLASDKCVHFCVGKSRRAVWAPHALLTT